MINGYKVIDADAHMQEPLDLWDKYVEPAFYDRRPIIKEHRYRLMFDYEESELYPAQPEGKDQMGRLRPTEILERQPIKYGEAYEEWWSPESRLRDMKRYGWDRMVCIPGTGAQPLKLENKDPELMWALTRAYHNWARDFCSADPDKLKMVASVPPYDMENTLIEFRRAVTELGAVTVMMPKPKDGVFWHHDEFTPFWDLAVELDVPISFHGVQSGSPHTGTRYQGVPGTLIALEHAIGFPFENMISLGHLIYTGVLERYPNLTGFDAGGQRRLGALLAGSAERPRRGTAGGVCSGERESHDHAAQRILQAAGVRGLRRGRVCPARRGESHRLRQPDVEHGLSAPGRPRPGKGASRLPEPANFGREQAEDFVGQPGSPLR